MTTPSPTSLPTTARPAPAGTVTRIHVDYTPLLLRSDPSCTHADVDAARRPVYDMTVALAGHITDALPLIAQAFDEVSPDPQATEAMLRVLLTFLDFDPTQPQITHWDQITPELAARFVLDQDVDTDAARLAKNTIHAAYLALADHGIPTGYGDLSGSLSPVHGLDPVPGDVRDDQRGKRPINPSGKRTRRDYTAQVHVRPASHDEVILARLAAAFAQTSRARHLAGAALAICCSNATTNEAPQVLWRDLDLDDGTISLPGRPADRGWDETAIAARTNRLDPWDAAVLSTWRAERSLLRPVDPDASALYGGNQPLTSNSAQICADQQVRKLLEIADLRREPGLSAGSFRYWAGARHAINHGLAAAAAHAGVHPATLHRQLLQLGERALRSR